MGIKQEFGVWKCY